MKLVKSIIIWAIVGYVGLIAGGQAWKHHVAKNQEYYAHVGDCAPDNSAFFKWLCEYNDVENAAERKAQSKAEAEYAKRPVKVLDCNDWKGKYDYEKPGACVDHTQYRYEYINKDTK